MKDIEKAISLLRKNQSLGTIVMDKLTTITEQLADKVVKLEQRIDTLERR